MSQGAFSTDVRILTCPQCGAPIQIARTGGSTQCGYCHAPLTFGARDDAPRAPMGPQLTDAERFQGLWAQAQVFGGKQLPPEMLQVLAGGALTPDRVGAALGIWQSYCQRAMAGDHLGGEFAVLMTGSLSSYFVVVAKDPTRQRALFESTYDALRDPAQKQVVRCMLARTALKAGDLPAARTWFGACDPHSPDLMADTAYRQTYACLATVHNDFRNVLGALGPQPNSVPIALTSRCMIDVLRANALERSGDVPTAIGQLIATARSVPAAKEAIPEIVEANAHLHLLQQSLRPAMQQW